MSADTMRPRQTVVASSAVFDRLTLLTTATIVRAIAGHATKRVGESRVDKYLLMGVAHNLPRSHQLI